MTAASWSHELATLEKAGISLSDGLTPGEFADAEEIYGFRFPPDLRSFLSDVMPLGAFPNWREPDTARVRDIIEWPFRGMRFDIEHNAFWFTAWGPRPLDLAEAIETARKHVATAPFLVPVHSHRFMPSEPEQEGNPVLSVHQTDIIYYGRDLRDYIANEFGGAENLPRRDQVRRVRFWSDLIENDDFESSIRESSDV